MIDPSITSSLLHFQRDENYTKRDIGEKMGRDIHVDPTVGVAWLVRGIAGMTEWFH